MKPVDNQIDAYRKVRALKQHEQEMFRMIKADWRGRRPPERILDIGCATGVFLELLAGAFPAAKLFGLDSSQELLDIAARRLAGRETALIRADASMYRARAKFDIVVASGILSIFEDCEATLDRWLRMLSPRGAMYIFGRFNSRDVDTIVRFRNNYNKSGWEAGLTSYAVATVRGYINKRGFKADFKRFRLKIDLPQRADPIRTYTVKTTRGEKLVLDGANIVAEQYFVRIQKKR